MKTVYLTLFAICFSLCLSSCDNKSQNQKVIKTSDSLLVVREIDTLKLINNKCFSCHNPDLKIDNRLAPPIFKVREHYLSDSITKVEFVNAIWKFVQNPSEELCLAAVQQNVCAIQYIENPSEELQLIAVKKNYKAAAFCTAPAAVNLAMQLSKQNKELQ